MKTPSSLPTTRFKKAISIDFTLLYKACLLFLTAFLLMGAQGRITESGKITTQPPLSTADSMVMVYRQFDQARSIYFELLEGVYATSPNGIYFRLAELEIRAHNFSKALFYLRRLEEDASYLEKISFRISVDIKKARIYSSLGQEDQAILIYKEVIKSWELNDIDDDRWPSIYNMLGAAMASLQMDAAEDAYKTAIRHAAKRKKIHFAPYNNIIDFYIDRLNFDAADKYLDTLTQMALTYESAHNLVSAKTKRAHLLALIGEQEEAIKVLYEGRRLAEDRGIGRSPSDYIFDSYVFFNCNEIDSALFYAEPTLEYALEKKEFSLAEDCMMHLAKVYTAAEKHKKAGEIYERYFFLQKTNNKGRQIENISLMEEAKADKKSGLVRSSLPLVTIGFFLCAAGSYFLGRKQQEKTPTANHKDLAHQLQIKTELLTKNKIAHQQCLDFLSHLKTEIRKLNHDKSKLNKNVNQLVHHINQSIDFQSQWSNINMYFAQLFPSFLAQLKAKYPKLTDTEIRHCMFIKLNLTIEEIANILNIEPASVNSARYRLKKKVNLQLLNEWG